MVVSLKSHKVLESRLCCLETAKTLDLLFLPLNAISMKICPCWSMTPQQYVGMIGQTSKQEPIKAASHSNQSAFNGSTRILMQPSGVFTLTLAARLLPARLLLQLGRIWLDS